MALVALLAESISLVVDETPGLATSPLIMRASCAPAEPTLAALAMPDEPDAVRCDVLHDAIAVTVSVTVIVSVTTQMPSSKGHSLTSGE